MRDAVDEVRSRIDIVDLVGQRVALKRAGRDWKGLCPFHDDKNPSFQVSSTLGRYRCWSCGEAGDIFTWVMKTERVEFPEALRMLAERAGVTLARRTGTAQPNERAQLLAIMAEALAFFRDQLEKSREAREYCQRRGLEGATLDAWQVGYAPDEGSALASHLRRKGYPLAACKPLFLVDEDASGGYFDKFRGRIMFPTWDEKGDLVAFGGRLMGEGQPKYINSSDTPLYRKGRVLYGMHKAKAAIAASRRAVLVEGYLDVIACHRAGVENAVASLGTALSEDHAKLLKRWCDGVVILYDSDAAGQKAAERAIEVLEAEKLRVRVAMLMTGEDPDTLLRTKGAEAVSQAVAKCMKPLEYRLELLRSRLEPAQDEFWSEAIAMIAAAPSEREMEVQVMRLAPLFPHLRDKAAAAARIRADALALRKGVARKGKEAKAVVTLPSRSVPQLTSAERTVFHALLQEGVRARAFEALNAPDLFETALAADVAASVRASLAESPVGTPSNWLHLIEPESTRDLLADLQLRTDGEPITREVLEETLRRLSLKREERRLREFRGDSLDDAQRMEYLERLKRLKTSG